VAFVVSRDDSFVGGVRKVLHLVQGQIKACTAVLRLTHIMCDYRCWCWHRYHLQLLLLLLL
jgi:hypothetical protein